VDAREKIAAAVEYLKARGVKRPDPPLFKLFWRAGIHVPPPHFLGFFPLALLFGLPFAVLLTVALGTVGSVMGWLLVPRQLALAIPAGVAYGVAMAAVQKLAQREVEVPLWSEFDPAAPGGDDPW
jgi:hypothetical protein